MKLKKAAAAAVSCIFMFGAALGAYAMNNEKNIQETSSASYDSSDLAEYAEQIAGIVNSERASYGLSPLKLSPKLSQAANVRAGEIRQLFSHTRPDGTSCFTAISDAGITYSAAAENIAYGQKSPQSVMNAWMNSAGHRANILDENMEYIGVGVAYENGIYYWTQFFAASADLAETAPLPGTDSPAETTVTSAPEAEPEPETTTTPEKLPEETKAPVTEKVPETSPKPQETAAPSETKQPEKTEAPAVTECRPCETQCKTNCDGSISCTPVTPCETQCQTNCDGSISCTPVTPCETQCQTNCDGSISCTPVTPCETQCQTNCDGSVSCTPVTPCETQCQTNCDGSVSCTPVTPCETQCAAGTECAKDNSYSIGNPSGCPLQSGGQGNNILEWLVPQLFNSGSCNSSSSGSCGKDNSSAAGAQTVSGSGSCPYSSSGSSNPAYSVGSCWGDSGNSYGSGSCPYSSSGSSNSAYSVGSCWGD